MEGNALSVLSTNINQAWGLRIAHIVYPTLHHQLEASQTLSVNVTLGTKDKMEVYVPSATQALIKIDSGQIV